jgi:hydroxyquinol 1,2-dioxygenase
MPYVTESNLTDVVLARWADIPDARLRDVMAALIRHLHGFVRDVEPTGEEWFKAIDFLTRTGQLCDAKRQEFILLSDVLGVSMLVDAINHRYASAATPTTVEGPFHVPGSPEIGHGGNMAEGAPGIPCFCIGKVTDLDGRPIAGATLDMWQTDGEGQYEAQRDVAEPWMRGIFKSQADGTYIARTVAPIGYTIPMDGTVGELMSRTDISHMRPAHIHFCLEAPGFRRCVTHLFQRGDKYIDTDVVYGVKERLIADFVEHPPGKAPNGERIATPYYVVHYDFIMQPDAASSRVAAE